MTLKTVLKLLSLGLLLFLLLDSVWQMDVAATINNGLTNSKKIEIDKSKDIEALRLNAKEYLDIIRNNRRHNSRINDRRFFIILALLTIQIFLWKPNRKLNPTSN